jgi:hypothetical protein
MSKELTEREKLKQKQTIGKKFGRLTVVEFIRKGKNYHRHYKCKCDCGKMLIVDENNLKRGMTKSCGCLSVEKLIYRNKFSPRKDGHKYNDYSLYGVWKGIRKRCLSKTEPAYKDYGGRGITICDEWKDDYPAFLEWAKSVGFKKGLSIDRIDNNGNYCPENCRFVDLFTQANNKRNNIVFTINGITDTLPNFARKFNLNPKMLYARYYKNKDVKYVFKEIFNDQFVELTEKANQFSQLVKKVEQLERQLESETLAKQEGVEIIAELEQKMRTLRELIIEGRFVEALKLLGDK